MADSHLRMWFEDREQQQHAARLGTWLLISSEVALFSPLFALYAGYRLEHPQAFSEGVHHTALWLGTGMTAVLVTSSLTVALALHAVRERGSRRALLWVVATLALGVLFLGLKGWEYARHAREGLLPGAYFHSEALQAEQAPLFFTLYYGMTGLHALHVAAGVVLFLALAWGLRRGRLDRGYHTPLELGGMYWHLVDGIWLFLWPLFYLMR